MYRTLDLKNRTTRAIGCFAGYFRLSKRRGVRVYGAGDPCVGFTGDCAEFKYQVHFGEAQADYKLMKQIQCSITPKVYEIVAVKLKGLWYPGIIMEHVEGKHLNNFLKDESGDDLMRRVFTEFSDRTGYIHEDLHGYNVFFKRTKKGIEFKVIDITCDTATPSWLLDEAV